MHQPTHQPSEKFLLIHRLYTFLDEWLFYGVLLLLYFNGVKDDDPIMFWTVAFLGATFMIVSYMKMWYMEAMRFETDEQDGSQS